MSLGLLVLVTLECVNEMLRTGCVPHTHQPYLSTSFFSKLVRVQFLSVKEGTSWVLGEFCIAKLEKRN